MTDASNADGAETDPFLCSTAQTLTESLSQPPAGSQETAAESQWATSPPDIIYHHASIGTLHQTDTLILCSLTKPHNNIRKQNHPVSILLLPLLQASLLRLAQRVVDSDEMRLEYGFPVCQQ